MPEEVKKLSGEARVDALVVALVEKHGFPLSPEIIADAYTPVEDTKPKEKG